MTLDADRRRLERAALTDHGEAARAHGRERLRALATVPVEQQTRALNALLYERGTVDVSTTWGLVPENEVRTLVRAAVGARMHGPTWLGATVPRTRMGAGVRAVIVLAARVADAVVVGVGRGTAASTQTWTLLGGRRAWRFTWPWTELDLLPKPRRYVPAAEAHARIAAWALRPAEDRVLLSLEAAKQWAGPDRASVFTTAPGGNDRFGVRGWNVLTAVRATIGHLVVRRDPDGVYDSIATDFGLPEGTLVGVDALGRVVPMREGVTPYGTVVRYDPDPNDPAYASVAFRPSPDARGSLELRLGEAVARRTFPPTRPETGPRDRY